MTFSVLLQCHEHVYVCPNYNTKMFTSMFTLKWTLVSTSSSKSSSSLYTISILRDFSTQKSQAFMTLFSVGSMVNSRVLLLNQLKLWQFPRRMCANACVPQNQCMLKVRRPCSFPSTLSLKRKRKVAYSGFPEMQICCPQET